MSSDARTQSRNSLRLLPHPLKHIRWRLTCWYMSTTTLILLLYSGLLYSTILKMVPLSFASREAQRLGCQFLLLGLAILLVVALSGYWLAAHALHPVQMMTRTAERIGQTSLSDRLQVRANDELGELATTFNAMLGRIETAFSRLRQFTADASHELRTPLSTITMVTNRVLSQWAMPENAEQALAAIAAYRQELEIVQAEVQHMTRMVNALLTLARVDTDQQMLMHSPLDMSEVILDVVERLATLAHQYGVELSLGALPVFPMRGDRGYLASMLTNLIENGLKYTAGIGQRVHIESGVDGDQWGWIRVQDDGPGIAEEHWPHLFDRFYRVDPARVSNQEGREDPPSSSGSGLGLALVAWIIRAHSGTIYLQSRVGSGSCFEVRLPLLNDVRSDKN